VGSPADVRARLATNGSIILADGTIINKDNLGDVGDANDKKGIEKSINLHRYYAIKIILMSLSIMLNSYMDD